MDLQKAHPIGEKVTNKGNLTLITSRDETDGKHMIFMRYSGQ